MVSYCDDFTVLKLIACVVLKGSVTVEGESVPIQQYHTAVLSNSAHETGVSLTAGTNDTEFVLVRLPCIHLDYMF